MTGVIGDIGQNITQLLQAHGVRLSVCDKKEIISLLKEERGESAFLELGARLDTKYHTAAICGGVFKYVFSSLLFQVFGMSCLFAKDAENKKFVIDMLEEYL